MTDPTKPPERVYVSPCTDEYGKAWKTRAFVPDAPEYILASSLPGSVEEIEELYLCARAIAQHQHDNHGGLMKDLRRALAAMKPKEKKP